jgi:acyl dehydratase
MTERETKQEAESMRFYEDFSVGDVREVGSYTVSREEIIEFATRFDPQPFHIDEAAARASIFGELTGSSTHTFALMGLIHARSNVKIALVANLGSEYLRFPTPLRPDDQLTLTSETAAKRTSKSRPGIGIVTTRSKLVNERQESVMEVSTTFMVRRRDAKPDAAR